MNFADALPIIWPLTFLLLALFVLKKADAALQPIIINVIGGVAKNATQNSLAYAMAAMLAVLSGMQAAGEVATQFHCAWLAIATKIMTPVLATIVAAFTRSPVSQGPSQLSTEPQPPKPSAP